MQAVAVCGWSRRSKWSYSAGRGMVAFFRCEWGRWLFLKLRFSRKWSRWISAMEIHSGNEVEIPSFCRRGLFPSVRVSAKELLFARAEASLYLTCRKHEGNARVLISFVRKSSVGIFSSSGGWPEMSGSLLFWNRIPDPFVMKFPQISRLQCLIMIVNFFNYYTQNGKTH